MSLRTRARTVLVMATRWVRAQGSERLSQKQPHLGSRADPMRPRRSHPGQLQGGGGSPEQALEGPRPARRAQTAERWSWPAPARRRKVGSFPEPCLGCRELPSAAGQDPRARGLNTSWAALQVRRGTRSPGSGLQARQDFLGTSSAPATCPAGRTCFSAQ